jgi:thioredoxin 1
LPRGATAREGASASREGAHGGNPISPVMRTVAPVKSTDETFEQDVLRSKIPVLVDFWAPWCGPCKAIEPALDALAERHAGRLVVTRVNVDESVEAAARYGVLALPTVILFAGGRAEETLIGARRRSDYEDAVERWL